MLISLPDNSKGYEELDWLVAHHSMGMEIGTPEDSDDPLSGDFCAEWYDSKTGQNIMSYELNFGCGPRRVWQPSLYLAQAMKVWRHTKVFGMEQWDDIFIVTAKIDEDNFLHVGHEIPSVAICQCALLSVNITIEWIDVV